MCTYASLQARHMPVGYITYGEIHGIAGTHSLESPVSLEKMETRFYVTRSVEFEGISHQP